MGSKPGSGIPDSPGKIRPAQLITTYGPGSIMQTNYDSVMIMGIDFWGHKNTYIRKQHLYLEKITKCNHFRMPYAEPRKRTIACTSYPRWGYCTICKWLQPHKGSPGSTSHFTCKSCPGKLLLPARLLVVCKRGHVGEFPWKEWAHSKSESGICDSPKLRWIRGNRSSSITDSAVKCDFCNAKNRLTNALSSQGVVLRKNGVDYTYECGGELPWLDKQETCKKISNAPDVNEPGTEIPIGMLSRAASLYYAKITRGIIIPRLAHPIVKFLQSDNYKSYMDKRLYREMSKEKLAEEILEDQEDFKARHYTAANIISFMEKLDARDIAEVNTEDDLKHIEYDDLLHNDNFDDEQDEKEIKICDVQLDYDDRQFFDVIRKLDIVTSVEVSRYFTRLRPPGEEHDSKHAASATICKLEVAGKTMAGRKYKRNGWLPCAVKKGEGIFVKFNREFIKSCLNHRGIQERLDTVLGNHNEWEAQSGWTSSANIDRQYILLHSLSHMLIRELALASGYNEASISERVYSSKHMCGLMIYTSSGEGSLGGLARQAKCGFSRILKAAIEKSQTCSRDPMCISYDPARAPQSKMPLHMAQNGSACYGCLMLPETSCENFNMLLDRQTLTAAWTDHHG